MNTDKTNQDEALEQVQTIKRFFEEGQKHIYENGVLLMFWGVLIPAATAAFYALAAKSGYDSIAAIAFWPAVSVFGAAVSVITGMRKSKRAAAQSFAVKISSFMWIGFLLSILILFAVHMLGGDGMRPLFLSTIALLLGMAYWTYGSILQLGWFRLFSAVWWIAALVIAPLEWAQASIGLAGCTFVCSFIPGLVMFTNQKK